MTFKTFKDAYASNYVKCSNFTSDSISGIRITKIDVSAPNEFGCAFDLVIQKFTYDNEYGYSRWETIETVAHAKKVWFTEELNKINQKGCFSLMFKIEDINKAYNHKEYRMAIAKNEFKKTIQKYNTSKAYANHDLDHDLYVWLISDRPTPIPDKIKQMKIDSGLSWTKWINSL